MHADTDPLRATAAMHSQPIVRDPAADAGALRLLTRRLDPDTATLVGQMLGLLPTPGDTPKRAISGAVMDETYSEKRREADRRRTRARTPEQKAARRAKDAERRRLRDLAREAVDA